MDRWDLSNKIERFVPGEDLLTLQPGRIVELEGPPGFGLTRLGYRMLADPSRQAHVVALDVRGWMSPLAAWEAGVDHDRLVVVRCGDPRLWAQVAAALCEGVRAVFAEVPAGVKDADIRKLAALARARSVRMALRPLKGGLATGVSYLRLRSVEIAWRGPEAGHGRLAGRRLVLEASGKGMAGMTRLIEVEEEGEDAVRVVPGLVVGEAGRAAG
ncbi:MAG: hypothetical protein OEM66_00550 [Acidimicrobiia bacterium]|nr:hypothetical protein [Acidimicrobiia bacterium]